MLPVPAYRLKSISLTNRHRRQATGVQGLALGVGEEPCKSGYLSGLVVCGVLGFGGIRFAVDESSCLEESFDKLVAMVPNHAEPTGMGPVDLLGGPCEVPMLPSAPVQQGSQGTSLHCGGHR